MLYWICPECGQECSPAVRECPTCTAPPVSPSAASGLTAASSELLSLAQNFASTTAATVTSGASRKAALSANGHEKSAGGSAVAIEEEVPPLFQHLARLDRVEFHAAFEPSLQPSGSVLKPAVCTAPARIPAPAIDLHTETARSLGALPAAKEVPAGKIAFEPSPAIEPGAAMGAAEALPSRRRAVAFVRAELPLAGKSSLGKSGLAPLPHLLPHPSAGSDDRVFAPSGYRPGLPASVPSGLTPAESLSALLNGLKTAAEDEDRRAVEAIESSFAEPPATPLLMAPSEIVQAPAPLCEKWLGTGKLKFTALEPESAGRAALIGPRAPTLAGPTLPPQLLNFGQQPSTLGSRRKRFPTWPFALAATLIVTLLALQYLTQARGGKTLPAALPVPIAKVFSAPRFHVAEEHPAARFVEVAGIRILTPAKHKPQVQFIVINHSAAEVTGLNIHIAINSADAASDAPLFTVSSIVSALGPEQSKEIRVDVNSPIQASDIPVWQQLRPEVQIGR